MTNTHLVYMSICTTQYLHIIVNWLSQSNNHVQKVIIMCEYKDCNHIKHNDIMPFPIWVLLYMPNHARKHIFGNWKMFHKHPWDINFLHKDTYGLIPEFSGIFHLNENYFYSWADFCSSFSHCPADALMCFYHGDIWL